MKTQVIIAPPAIAGYVSHILVIENDHHLHPHFELPLFANGCPSLVFQTVTALKQDQTIGHLTLYGQLVKPTGLSLEGDFMLIAYLFYPYALPALFGMAAHELTDHCLNMAFQQQAKAISLEAQLLDQPSLAARLDLLNHFILQCSLPASTNRKIVFATQAIIQSNTADSLISVQKELNISERTFQRLFESHVGITPRLFSRICQFNGAFQQLNQYQFAKLSDVAYEHHFADQSHFIRTFKEFTGLTPKEYLAKLAPYNPKF